MIMVQHKNNFSGYLSDWRNTLNLINVSVKKQKAIAIPKPFIALHNQSFDLNLMLRELDTKFTILEGMDQFDLEKYLRCVYHSSVVIKSSRSAPLGVGSPCSVLFELPLPD